MRKAYWAPSVVQAVMLVEHLPPTPMAYLSGFLCKTAFFECADRLLSDEPGAFDVYKARNVLMRTTLCSDVFERYGQILIRLLTASATESQPVYVEADAMLLSDFLWVIAPWSEGVTSILETEPSDESRVHIEAFLGMNEHPDEDAPRQGLEFIRVYMRTFLQLQARAAHQIITGSLSSPPAWAPAWASMWSPKPMPLLSNNTIVGTSPTVLDEVLFTLGHSTKPHPALAWLVEHKLVNPSEVLDALHGIIPDTPDPLRNTAFCAFIGAMRAFVVNGQWLPETPQRHFQVWRVHARLKKQYCYLDSAWEEAFIRRMTHEYKDCLHHALAYIADASLLEKALMEEFFPLPFAECDAREVLSCLVELELQVRQSICISKVDAFFALMHTTTQKFANCLRCIWSCSPNTKTQRETARCCKNASIAFEKARFSRNPWPISTAACSSIKRCLAPSYSNRNCPTPAWPNAKTPHTRPFLLGPTQGWL